MLDNVDLPKIDHNFSDLTADSLQQAWQGENKQRRWRRFYRLFVIFIIILMLGGLLLIGWSTVKQDSSGWALWLKNKQNQVIKDIKQWQNNNERAVIEGNLLR
jgi:uncharacterized BrkB/YihY/UPF0761 family membrane protein